MALMSSAPASAAPFASETPEMYARLGIRPVINASATLTRLGGSVMPPEAITAMADAAQCFVPLDDLQRAVGARIAELTGNDACYVSSGAAAGITVAIAACVAGTDPELTAGFPYLHEFKKTEVIIHTGQRNGYDYAARQTGATLIEVGNDASELAAAITDRTACVLWFAGEHYAAGGLTLDRVIAVAHDRGIPVLVDAAAQIPPMSNLRRFTKEFGADIAIFSGGKGLRGPQSSGLVLGRPDLIAACWANGNPNHSLGRPMKVGKEEMIGLLAAIEWNLAQDEPALLNRYEEVVQGWIDGLHGIPGVTAERGYPSEAGQPHGRAIVHFQPPCPLNRDQVAQALWDHDPHIAVAAGGIPEDAIALNPQTLAPGEEAIVLQALTGLLQKATRR